MLPVIKIPKEVEEFSKEYVPAFSQAQYYQFQKFITGMMISDTFDIEALSKGFKVSQSYDALHHFVSEGDWSIDEVFNFNIGIIKQMPLDRTFTDDGILAIDDTLIEKFGKHIEGVSKQYDHAEGRYVQYAHNLLGLIYINPQETIRYPLNFSFYRSSKESAKHGTTFKTKIELGKEMITWSIEKGISFQTVVFDSWFLSKDMADFIEEVHKDWISMVKSNRLIRVNGKNIAIDEYSKNLEDKDFRETIVNEKRYKIHHTQKRLHCLKREETIRILICYEWDDKNNKWKEPVFLATNNKTLRAERIIKLYTTRWGIETFFRDAKQNLGLGKYRMRKLKSIKSYWCLVFTSAILLELIRLDTKMVSKKSKVSFGEIKRVAFARSIKDIIQYVSDQAIAGISVNQIILSLKL